MKRKGSKVIMTENAVENYGEKYRDVVFVITHVSRSEQDHPGYDSCVGENLYDLKFAESNIEFGSSLYEYEVNSFIGDVYPQQKRGD